MWNIFLYLCTVNFLPFTAHTLGCILPSQGCQVCLLALQISAAAALAGRPRSPIRNPPALLVGKSHAGAGGELSELGGGRSGAARRRRRPPAAPRARPSPSATAGAIRVPGAGGAAEAAPSRGMAPVLQSGHGRVSGWRSWAEADMTGRTRPNR